MKSLIFTVTNDLSFDQRMDRICGTLAANGYKVKLVGRRRRSSKELTSKEYGQKRIRCFFDKGKLFYLEYNFKLFWYLLFHRFDVVCAVDLDTILPAYLIATIKRKPLVYDAHEYFTEMEEIVSRPIIHRAWLSLERFVIPRIKHAYTISNGYASLYQKVYNKTFEVLRNVPFKSQASEPPKAERTIIYQGALNVGRGLEVSIRAMRALPNFTLKIYGDGPIKRELQDLCADLDLGQRVQFMGLVDPDELRQQTMKAWVGLCLFSDVGLHHKYSLGNRFFDYFHANVPQIAMNFPEYAEFNTVHEVAYLISELNESHIIGAIKELDENRSLYERLKSNCTVAREVNCWEKESVKLLKIYSEI